MSAAVYSVAPSAARFRDRNNWLGGHDELAIELGPRDDMRLDAAFRALWSSAGIEHCVESNLIEPAEQSDVSLELAQMSRAGSLHGVARLPAGATSTSDSSCASPRAYEPRRITSRTRPGSSRSSEAR